MQFLYLAASLTRRTAMFCIALAAKWRENAGPVHSSGYSHEKAWSRARTDKMPLCCQALYESSAPLPPPLHNRKNTQPRYILMCRFRCSSRRSFLFADCRPQTLCLPVIFDESVFIRKLSTFSCKRRMGSSRQRKLEVALDFYV